MKTLTKKIFFVAVGLALLSAAGGALAQTTGCPTIEFKLSTPLPGVKEITQVDCASIGSYIVQLFTFGVYVAGFLSAIVMMIGGFLWLTAGGNSSQVSTAKSFFGGGLSGFVLILVSWTLLNTINPNLVKFKPLNITPIQNIGLQSQTSTCVPMTGDAVDTRRRSGENWTDADSSRCPAMPSEQRIGGSYQCYCLMQSSLAVGGGAPGQECTKATDCASLYCKLPQVTGEGVKGVCAEAVVTGQSCTFNFQCETANCEDGYCTNAAPFPSPHECRTNDQCQSNQCVNYQCAAPLRPLLPAGGHCVSDSDCISGSCENYIFSPTGKICT